MLLIVDSAAYHRTDASISNKLQNKEWFYNKFKLLKVCNNILFYSLLYSSSLFLFVCYLYFFLLIIFLSFINVIKREIIRHGGKWILSSTQK